MPAVELLHVVLLPVTAQVASVSLAVRFLQIRPIGLPSTIFFFILSTCFPELKSQNHPLFADRVPSIPHAR